MRKIAFVRALVVVASVVSTTVASGGARADSPPSGTNQNEQGPQPGQQGQQGQQGRSESGDIVQLIDHALSQVSLRSDQKQALQGIASDVDAKVAAVDEAKRELLKALADQIESGHVDENALQPETKRFVDASDAASPAVRQAIQKLHDALDAQQRKEFVDALRGELQQASSTLSPEATLDQWASVLHLSDDQKQKIRQILSSQKPLGDRMRDRIDKVLDAFPSDQFRIDDVLPSQGESDRAEAVAKDVEDVASQVTDVLTPEQRKTAADKIREQLSGQSTQGPGSGGERTGRTTSGLESVGSTSEGLWGGYGGFGVATGYGFAGGFAAGFGGGFLF